MVVYVGTVEQKIDEAIQTKRQIAGINIGAGGHWLRKLCTEGFNDPLTLRQEGLGE